MEKLKEAIATLESVISEECPNAGVKITRRIVARGDGTFTGDWDVSLYGAFCPRLQEGRAAH